MWESCKAIVQKSAKSLLYKLSFIIKVLYARGCNFEEIRYPPYNVYLRFRQSFHKVFAEIPTESSFRYGFVSLITC